METRKHHLDWLRVLAFLFLILFHVGCLYAPWDYNLKSPRLVPATAWWLGALGAWRMALLFFISGVACRFLLDKLGAGGFARDRLRRLLPVILFGMLVVIPPQTFVELRAKGVTQLGYLDFWLGEYLAADQTLVAPLHKTMSCATSCSPTSRASRAGSSRWSRCSSFSKSRRTGSSPRPRRWRLS